MTEQKFSKRAIWMAVNSEHGDRLVEIAREHVRLAKELTTNQIADLDDGTTYNVRGIIAARIEQLREERNAIINQFEEEDSYGDSSI